MRFDSRSLAKRVLRRYVVGGIAGIAVFSAVINGSVHADPADDGVAKITELSRQAEQLTESMHSAQLDLDNKLQVQAAAEKKHTDDLATVDAAKAQLATYQGAVDNFAAAVYMGGPTDGLNAILTAESPQGLIDKMAVQKVMATEMAAQMQSYRRLSDEATKAEAASAKSAADAKTAAEQAAAVRADLQRKQSQLQVQIAIVKSRYQTLSPDQRTALAAPGPVPPPEILAAPAPDALPPLDAAPAEA
ncbi:MAG TPA: endopeptidase, partial [Mycobacterium sp.]